MKTRHVILLGIAALVLGITVILGLIQKSVESRIGPLHVYELADRPSFLSEELAIAKAHEAMIRDGLDITSWQEVGGCREMTSNRVVFTYTNSSASTRFVHIELDSRRVTCQISVGK